MNIVLIIATIHRLLTWPLSKPKLCHMLAYIIAWSDFAKLKQKYSTYILTVYPAVFELLHKSLK